MENYILVVKKSITYDQMQELLAKYDMEVDKTYDKLRRHYKVKMDPKFKENVKKEPQVVHITEANAPVQLVAEQQIDVKANAGGDNWGLARISKQNNWNDSGWFPVRSAYRYFRTGEGVDAYIVDTGIRRSHNDFEGRIEVIYDAYRYNTDPEFGEDKQGHGTHVASTVGGKKYGVAKKVNIKVVRIFDEGYATLEAVLGGFETVLEHHELKKENGANRPSVMNLSIGGPKSTVEEEALNDCIEAGIICVAAAGNDGKNLDDNRYNVLPAEIRRAITVGAVDIKDRITSFSNYGSIVDVFAPGAYIAGAGIGHDNDEAILSGTSMATPHVTGVVAQKMEGADIGRNENDVLVVHDFVVNESTSSTLLLHENARNQGTPNRMLYSVFSEAQETPVVEEPEQPEEPVVEQPKTDVQQSRSYLRRLFNLLRLLRELGLLSTKESLSRAPMNVGEPTATDLRNAAETLAAAKSKEEVLTNLNTFFSLVKQAKNNQ